MDDGGPTTGVDELSDEIRYRVVESRDERFDGWFVTAVLTTRIYCRPSCPARTPRPRNVRFYPTAAAAQHAGFRACKRCRPDATPGSPEWNTRADVVTRAMRLIADGEVEREGVPGLARRLGYSERQIERLLRAELGAGPLALARAQRAQTARLLVETTELPITEIAFAAGFASVRQFNDTMQQVFATSPSALRARARPRTRTRAMEGTTKVSVRLPLRAPFTPDTLFGHLAATAIPGCEEVVGTTYRRTLTLPHGHGIVALTPHADHIGCTLRLRELRDLPTAIARCRRLLDLDADPQAVGAVLERDPKLGPAHARSPGRRIPRTLDGHELAVRAVIGQQIATSAARTHGARLVERYGQPILDEDGGLTHCFPSTEALAAASPDDFALPGARRRTLVTLVAALDDGSIDLDPGADWAAARHALRAIPGIGPWTTELVAMRALGDPDAFPASDLGVRAGARALGLGPTDARLLDQSRSWAPWRAYAVQYLWAALDHPVNHWPPRPKESSR